MSARSLEALGDAVPEQVRSLVAQTVSEAGRPADVLVAVNRPGTGARAFGCFPRYRVLADLGLPLAMLRWFALLARCAGLLGQLAEEQRMPIANDIYLSVDRNAVYVVAEETPSE